MTRVFLTRISIGVWLLAVGGGFSIILNYQSADGRVGNTPGHWPSGTQITPGQGRDTLIMFAHPQCPCSRASVGELNRLLARSQGNAAAQVWFFSPGKFPANWAKSDLWRTAAAIPGVAVHEDRDGAQARLFGAETSGYVLLYDTAGRLLFKGGITDGRGHSGDNAGENAVISLLTGGKTALSQTKVYGCSLLEECVAAERVVVR